MFFVILIFWVKNHTFSSNFCAKSDYFLSDFGDLLTLSLMLTLGNAIDMNEAATSR